MRSKTVTIPDLALIAGTRAALGAGIALLMADRLTRDQRRAIGWTLLAVGALTTIPLAAKVVFGSRPERLPRDPDADEALAGIMPPKRWFEHALG